MTTTPPAAGGPQAAGLVVVLATIAPLAVYFAIRPFTGDAVALA